jgi:hypothetical protein
MSVTKPMVARGVLAMLLLSPVSADDHAMKLQQTIGSANVVRACS